MTEEGTGEEERQKIWRTADKIFPPDVDHC